MAQPDGARYELNAGEVVAMAPERDVLLRSGPPVAGDFIEIGDPVIVVEVLSQSSRHNDTGGQLDDYFRLPSVRH